MTKFLKILPAVIKAIYLWNHPNMHAYVRTHTHTHLWGNSV